MSLFSQHQADMAEAQSILAQLSGMSEGGSNTTYMAEDLILVYGQPALVERPNSNGGWTHRVEIRATMTRAQRATCPTSQSLITRTDVTPNVTYRIAESDAENDSVNYVLTLVKVAG